MGHGKIMALTQKTAGSHDPADLRKTSRCSVGLGFADLEHRGAAARADALGRRLTVLHRDSLSIPHYLLALALDAIPFHLRLTILSCRRERLLEVHYKLARLYFLRAHAHILLD